MSASLVWTPVPTDPGPLGSAKHPLLGLVLLALDTDEASLYTGLAIAKGDDAVTFLRGALAALPAQLPPGGIAGNDRDHLRWRVELHQELAALLDDIDRLGEVLVQVQR